MATRVKAEGSDKAKTAKKATAASTERAPKGKVAKRSWSLAKFTLSVKNACKKAEVPVKSISASKIEDHYEKGSSVKKTVEAFAA